MTEEQWNACTDPQAIFDFIRGSQPLTVRQVQLLGASFCRQRWVHLARGCHRVVETVERAADGLAGEEDILRVVRATMQLRRWTGDVDLAVFLRLRHLLGARVPAPDASLAAVLLLANAAVYNSYVPPAQRNPGLEYSWGEWVVALSKDVKRGQRGDFRRGQCNRLRCVLGLSFFRSKMLDPAVLAWNSGTITRLAQAAYDERELPCGHLDREKLAVLADALEEAGATDPDLLGHLRGPRVHVRGCWLLDLLLQKA